MIGSGIRGRCQEFGGVSRCLQSSESKHGFKHTWLMIGSGIRGRCQEFRGVSRCLQSSESKHDTDIKLLHSSNSPRPRLYQIFLLCSCCITMNPPAIWVLGHPQCVELNEQDTRAAAALILRGQLRDGRIRRLP
jgi:hypothetical protein